MLPGKGIIIPLITFFLSLLNLYKNWHGGGTDSFFVSILGLIVVALYVLRVNYNRIAFYLWATSQLIIVRQQIPQGASGVLTADVLDLSQGFKLALFLPVTISGTQYEAGLNFFALFLVMLNRLLPNNHLSGLELSFSSYRHDNSLGVIFPVKGKVVRTVTLSGEDDWLLIQLNNAFQHEAMNIEYVLVKRNDKKSIIPGKSNQLVFFKLVPDVNMICEGHNDKTDFPHEVWALCK
jgi:hypothetical protein